MNRSPARYDLLACNLALASIAALLMAAVGSSVKVVQILTRTQFVIARSAAAHGELVEPRGDLVA